MKETTTTTTPTPLTAENWWEMIPGRKEGGAKLLKRCIELLAWRVDFAMNVLLAYKDFLEAKVSISDFDGTMLEPSMPIYQMWSQHILDTACYNNDCELLFGRVLHHDPDLFKDVLQRTARIQRTMQLVFEKNGGAAYIDPIVWSYGPPMYGGVPPPGPPMPPPAHYGFPATPPREKENTVHPDHKRPRTEGGIEHPHTAGYASFKMAPAFDKRLHPAKGRVAHPKEAIHNGNGDNYSKLNGAAGTVTLCIFKSTDGGAMDNKVTLGRNQPLRKVLDYYRYRCIWRQGKRLDLYCTPNDLGMGPVENVILTSIHVDEVITLSFRDWKGQIMSKEMRMRETIRDAYADQAEALGVDISKLIFQFRHNILTIDGTPLLAQLDHGDIVDVSLEGGVEETIVTNPGEEKMKQIKEEETSALL